jgi:RNA polymerase sigma-70 factor (ECF subfamily)
MHPPPDSRAQETETPTWGSDANAAHADCLHPRDLDLVQRVRRHEAEALQQFVQRMEVVPRFLAARNGQLGGGLRRDEVEDVTQDVLSIVWRKLPVFRGDAALESWVYRFCDLELRNAIRRSVRRRSQPLGDGHEPTLPVADHGLDVEALFGALDRLPADDAAVVRLKHFESATFEMVGSRLGLSPNTAKTRYYRAMETLRRFLQAREAADS